jgi:hypothetical protein
MQLTARCSIGPGAGGIGRGNRGDAACEIQQHSIIESQPTNSDRWYVMKIL